MSQSKCQISSLCFAVQEFESRQYDPNLEEHVVEELNGFLDTNLILSKGYIEHRRFVSILVKILTLADNHRQLAWTVLNVLKEICNASGNKAIVPHLQKLTPMISRLMIVAVKEDRKRCALHVLQTLTYGIVILHSDSFVAPLVASLIEFSKPGNDSSIIQLSLSVLANLLHRNKAVLLKLMETVNVKSFLKDIFSARSNVNCKMEVCKLMFLLEDLMHEKPNEGEVSNFIRVSLCTIKISCHSKNIPQLQHCVEFFADMVNEKKINAAALNGSWFSEIIQNLISQLNAGSDQTDLHCAMLLFKFLRVFIQMEIPLFSNFHQAIMQDGLAWVLKHKRNASEAIITMHSILASQIKYQSNQGAGMTGDELISVFLSLLKETSTGTSDYTFLSVLLNFLSAALEVELYNIVLKEHLDEKMIESLLELLPSNTNTLSNFNVLEPVVKMSIDVLNFVIKIVTCCKKSWLNFSTRLFLNQKVVSALGAALVFGSIETKAKVLRLVVSLGFPGESIELLAKSIDNCGSGRVHPLTSSRDDSSDPQFSLEAASTCADIDKLIGSVNNLINCDKLQQISTSQIFQLYQHKAEVNLEYQKSVESSLNRSNEERSLLKDELYLANLIVSNLREELSGLQSSFEEIHKKYNDNLESLEKSEEDLCNLKERFNEETTKCKDQIEQLKETSERQEGQLAKAILQSKEFREELQLKSDLVKSLSEENTELKVKNTNLSKEVEVLAEELRKLSKQFMLSEKEKKVKEEQLQELQRIRDTVFEITGGTKKF